MIFKVRLRRGKYNLKSDRPTSPKILVATEVELNVYTAWNRMTFYFVVSQFLLLQVKLLTSLGSFY